MKRSPLGLAVLALLVEAPMHPYRMQQLIKQRHKDTVVHVGHRASLYKTIERLLAAGLVAVHEVERDQLHPERTVYAVTEAGIAASREWMFDILAKPTREFPEFPAAISFLGLLTPAETRGLLTTRAAALRAELERVSLELREYGSMLPRVTLLESELLRAVTAAELAWVESVVRDLGSGDLRWDQDELRALAARFAPSEPKHPR